MTDNRLDPTASLLTAFDRYIAERTRAFTGRRWVFERIHDWLQDPDKPRTYLLTGEPGSGKTAIAGQVVRFSQDALSPPEGLPGFAPGFVSAYHFCSARDRRWINPHVFAQSLALQLAGRAQRTVGGDFRRQRQGEAETAEQ